MKFIVLPSTGDVAGVSIERLARTRLEVVHRASGRPWIIGDWDEGDVYKARIGNRRVVLLGRFLMDEPALLRVLDSAESLSDLSRITEEIPGSYHLVAELDEGVRIQGTLSSGRQIFYSNRGSPVLAASDPALLLPFVGREWDRSILASRLIAPWPPWPVSEIPVWKGVSALAPGHFLQVDSRTGTARQVRWWSPEEPHLTLERGAELLASAVHDAVRSRGRGRTTVSADLSGGLDSTGLCFVAAATGVPLVTTRWQATDVADEDEAWARKAERRLPGARHLTFDRRSAPGWFTELLPRSPGVHDHEGPFPWIRTRGRLVHAAEAVADEGSRTHLTGHGADELFFATPLNLHSLARTHPAKVPAHVLGYQALYRWRTAPTLRGLADSSTFSAWLGKVTDSLRAPLREFSAGPDFGWGLSGRMARWVAPEAVEAASEALRRDDVLSRGPLSRYRAQHASWQDARLCGDTLRKVNHITRVHGVSWEAPYLDDRVMRIALSVRFDQWSMPDRYKPLLVEALRGTAPPEILERSTKSEYSAEAYTGLRRSREAVAELCDGMRLEEHGLVDAEAFGGTVFNPPSSSFGIIPVINTLACESWLRSIEDGSREKDLVSILEG
ncbi:asparagine synthase-related protein [Nocardiopsis alba]|uniref:asparagine synthase-related protein n=1 Tax=Nocardiopsis alba TaxID=53437 RepID=UPI0033D55353